MEYFLPKPDYCRSKEWIWPHLDFDMDAEDLFTTLHDRFNTHAMPLQSPKAFYDDVREISRGAKSREELYSLLEARKNQRIKEMNEAWGDVGSLLSLKPRLMSCPICYDNHALNEKIPLGSLNDSVAERSSAAFKVTKFSSFDTLIAFFDGFVRDERKKRDDLRRDLDERWERLRQKRLKGSRAIASSAFEAAVEGHNEPGSSRNASTSIYPTDKPQPTASSGQRETTETPLQAPEGSTPRKRKRDEEAQAFGQKRRRTMSESDGDDDTLRPAAQQYQSKATEPTAPTSKQAEKRKRPGDLHEQDEARDKRPKLYQSTDPVDQGPSMFAASYYSPSNPLGGMSHSHSSTFAASYSPNNPLGGMSHSYSRRDEDNSGWASGGPPPRPFDLSELFYVKRLPPRVIEELPDTDPPVYTADTKRPREPLRANGRQPVDKGLSREEPETSSSQKQQPPQDNPSQEQQPQEQPPQKKPPQKKPPQKKPPQKKPPQKKPPQKKPPQKKPPQKKRQERKPSPTVERVLRSRRSSRRSTGQDLLFLSDDATPRVASRKRKL